MRLYVRRKYAGITSTYPAMCKYGALLRVLVFGVDEIAFSFIALDSFAVVLSIPPFAGYI